jgi:uncharacterized protein
MIQRFPTHPREIFGDTSALYASVDKDDDYHRSVVTRLEEIAAVGGRLIITNYVLAELHALLLARLNRHVALTSLQRLRENRDIGILRVSQDDERRAWEIVERYTDKDFSFTDATSFAVMERLAITHALSLDAHYAQYGWVMLQVERDEAE